MDDTNLARLSVSKGVLNPDFDTNIYSYTLTLGPKQQEVTFDWMSRDKGACCDLKGILGSGKTLTLAKGKQKEVKLEVTSEDGNHAAVYKFLCERLSGSDSNLESILFSDGETQLPLIPELTSSKSAEEQFHCSIPWKRTWVIVKVKPYDKESTIKLPDYAEKNEKALEWKVNMLTNVVNLKVEVTSMDKSTTTIYTFQLCRERPRVALQPAKQIAQLADIQSLKGCFCTFCCNVLNNPIDTRKENSDGAGSRQNECLFCLTCLDTLTMGSNFHPITGELMEGQWKKQLEEASTLVNLEYRCIYPRCQFSSSQNGVLEHIFNCDEQKTDCPFLTDQLSEATEPCEGCGKHIIVTQKTDHDANCCYGTLEYFSQERPTHFNPGQSVRGWEVRLIEPNILENLTVPEVESRVDAILVNYQNSLPEFSGSALTEEPVKILSEAAKVLASALSAHPRKYKLHMRLAQVLEEWNFVNETMLYHGNTVADRQEDSLQSAADSSKEEEVRAICARHGVTPTDTLAKKLKAVDAEYHQLLEWGKLSRADYVAFLYSWKSKKAAQEENASKFSSENLEDPFLQARDKYNDAIGLEQNNAELFLFAGKCDLLIGELSSAKRLFAVASAIRPSSTEFKFYIGLTTVLLKEKDRYTAALDYLLRGFDEIQKSRMTVGSDSVKATHDGHILQCMKKWVTHDMNVIRGLWALSKLLVHFKHPSSCLIIQSSLFLMQNGLSKIQRKNSKFYHRIMWNIFKTYFLYIKAVNHAICQSQSSKGSTNQNENSFDQSQITEWLCSNLASLIHHSNLRRDFKLSNLLEMVCQEAVSNFPNSSKFLYLLGFSQLGMYEVHEKESSLISAKLSFQVSVDLESKKFVDSEIHPSLKEQDRFSKLTAKLKEQSKESAKVEEKNQQTKAGKPNQNVKDNLPASRPAGRATAVANKTGAQTQPASRVPVKPAAISNRKLPQPSVARGKPITTPAAKNAPVRTNAGGSKTNPTAPATRNATVPKTQTSLASNIKGGGDTVASASPGQEQTEKKPVATGNEVSYMPRLGLARCMGHLKDLKSARDYYEQVFTMAPMLHEAYIEAGNLISKQDPLGAVDIYCRYPFHHSDGTFDDAYLHGEIVHLVTKHNPKPGDDPRLEFHISEWGKIGGINILEKYIEILIDKHCMDLVMRIYANVNGKSVDDEDMKQFYKLKGWI